MENVYHSPSEAADQPSIPTAIERKVQYLSAAAITDVLFDQLEYLIAHSGEACQPDCADCARLEQVSNLLLLPFRSVGRKCQSEGKRQ
jgi:hypothetical protein